MIEAYLRGPTLKWIFIFLSVTCTSCSESSEYSLYKINILSQFESSSESRILRTKGTNLEGSEIFSEVFRRFEAYEDKAHITDTEIESRSLVRRNKDGMSLRISASNDCGTLLVNSENLSICDPEVYRILYDATEKYY